VQTIVVAVAVEVVEAADTLAHQTADDMVEPVKAVVADVTEAANTLLTALVRCGIAAGVRSLESLAQARCMVRCC